MMNSDHTYLQTMENFKLIQQGAEAKLYLGTYLGKPAIIKERFIKRYRHPELDSSLTKERIKAESRGLLKCKSAGIRTPMVFLVDIPRRSIFMEYFEYSITAKEYIFKASDSFIEKLSHSIGILLGKMHAKNIIHGDLTTSNLLLVNTKNEHKYFDNFENLDLVVIDFGLAHVETSAEDKGVDLYVLERALLSTHNIHENIFTQILTSYQKQYKNGFKDVMAKYEDIRARGRKRTMVG